MTSVNTKRCIVCDYQKKQPDELADPVPLCLWCRGERVAQMLDALDYEMTHEVESSELLDCVNNGLFRFLSDLGELAASHTHLQTPRDVISALIMNVRGQNLINYFDLTGVAPRPRLVRILEYLERLRLVKLDFDESPYGQLLGPRTVRIPDNSLIHKAFISIEASASSAWEEHREPNLVLSYVLVKGLNETIKIITDKGNLNIGEGITPLYVTTSGKVVVPRQFTAPLVFILGNWAEARDELTQEEIIQFMCLRGLNNEQRLKVLRVLAGAQVGQQHTIYRLERFPEGSGSYAIRLVLNPRYTAIRDRIRDRMRS